jgi:predicted hydrocarbon binding protein
MEKIIVGLEKDAKDIIDGKSINFLRKELGDKIDIRAVRALVLSLQWASAGYRSALRLAGMKFGRRLGMVSEKTELSLVLGEIKRLFEALGVGKIDIELKLEEKDAKIKLYESYLTSGLDSIMQNLCFFEEGFIDGYINGVISKVGPLSVVGGQISVKQVDVEETKCIGLGNNFCEFSIKF